MNLTRSCRATFAIACAATVCLGQIRDRGEPSFRLSLTGNCGYGTGYRCLLNSTGDSGVIIVNGRERPVGWADFRRIKAEIVNYAMELTEAAYGSPRDSADFKGELAIAALDRNTVIRLNAALTVGTLGDGPMTDLLRLLMKQVDDTLRLPQVSAVKPAKKKKAARPPLDKK
ncbi:MAG: hypothetical protein JW699_01100 [Chitinispirillaceae bacterium]|nr:hypothetical protein [Chitinispirillaceae bacterium]